jgi:hypothetical protein
LQVEQHCQLFGVNLLACFAFSANYTQLPRFNAIFLIQKDDNLCRARGGKQWLFE